MAKKAKKAKSKTKKAKKRVKAAPARKKKRVVAKKKSAAKKSAKKAKPKAAGRLPGKPLLRKLLPRRSRRRRSRLRLPRRACRLLAPSLHRRRAAAGTAEVLLRNRASRTADSGCGRTALGVLALSETRACPASAVLGEVRTAAVRQGGLLKLPVQAASRPFAHQLGCEPYDVGWRGVNLLEQSLDLGAADWLHVKIEFARFGAELGIVHGGVEGRA